MLQKFDLQTIEIPNFLGNDFTVRVWESKPKIREVAQLPTVSCVRSISWLEDDEGFLTLGANGDITLHNLKVVPFLTQGNLLTSVCYAYSYRVGSPTSSLTPMTRLVRPQMLLCAWSIQKERLL